MTPKRIDLYKQLPLNTPLSVHIFPIYKCNFKCNYCIFTMSNEELEKKGFKKDVMPFEIYKKAIDDLKQYDNKLRALMFAGHGEPLMHKDIAKMVKYAKDNDVAERIEITTNGSLLTPKMSDALIDAGLDRIKISIQGTTKEKYREIAEYEINYEKFLTNLKYFHDNKKHTEVYIKIIDIALEGKDDEKKFLQMFESISTYVDIEYAIPFVKEIDDSIYNKEFDRCKQGNKDQSKICSMPFYMQVVTPTGDVLPCCSTDVPIVLGNVNKKSLKEIWDSNKQNSFLKMMLKDRNLNITCKSCSVPEYGLQKGDYLDGKKDELLIKYNKVAKNES